ncbi:GspH/FimT family protein [Pseudomonas sp. NFIX28]|jgi:type IV fimbrial biogenesis protein FimT|uniref:GspH/FimT family pseudopilin n=1 Tax=Pseudomonas sp. NFIX28 TaxID=1566235 RepID=UPI000897B621|nr:GspH/FimT family protein [Pseudomonas sp. NFIX28]SDZ57754.1 type IV fimbrial biogenesis protein FimT [Pseudomonas sp. NFIX28]
MLQKGFSLIEIVVALALASLLMLFASTSFGELLQSTRRLDAAQMLASGIRNARTEAILRQQRTVIHGVNDDWSQGWRIILDISGEGSQDSDNPVLLERRGDARVAIVGNRPVQHYVRFSGLGDPHLPSGAFQAGTLHICAVESGVSQHQVVLSRSGRVSLRSDKTAQALCDERG